MLFTRYQLGVEKEMVKGGSNYNNLQSQITPGAVKYRQVLVPVAFTNILKTGLQEREQAQKKIERLTKRVVKRLEHLMASRA